MLAYGVLYDFVQSYIHSTSHFHKSVQPTIELLTADGHLYRIERVLHNKVGVQLVYLPYHRINVRLLGLRKQQKFRPGQGLETLYAEVTRLEDFNAAGP